VSEDETELIARPGSEDETAASAQKTDWSLFHNRDRAVCL
jgi:hypothetical protein